jgi:hypothetical protein
MHAAINEVGALYVSAACPDSWDAGWDVRQPRARPNGFGAKGNGIWKIPFQKAPASEGGHAFAIIGYNEHGFLIQNSWGEEWGTRGLAILTYDDWLVNGWDCWVAQLGVRTSEHDAISQSTTLRVDSRTKKVELSASDILRNREIAPFVVNMANNGQLSNAGQFRTSKGDLEALVDVHLAQARKLWKLEGKPLDVCIYAHGGLVGEGTAAKTAAQWIRKMYDRQVFPVFLMWETDFMSTLTNRLEDGTRNSPHRRGRFALVDRAQVERGPGAPRGAGRRHVLGRNEAERRGDQPGHPHRQRQGTGRAQRPAALQALSQVRRQTAAGTLSPGRPLGGQHRARLRHRRTGQARREIRVGQLHGARDHPAAVPLAGGAAHRRRHHQALSVQPRNCRGRQLRPVPAFAAMAGQPVFRARAPHPILGVQKYFGYGPKLKNTTIHVAPGPASQSTTHGGFDDDDATRDQVLKFIRGK